MRPFGFLFLLLTLFTPWHAVRASIIDDGAASDIPTCSESSYQCRCGETTTATTGDSDRLACYAQCKLLGASTWGLYCTQTMSTLPQSVAGGAISYTAPATEEPKNDPVVPNLNVDIGVTFTDPTQDGEYTRTNFLAEYVDGLYRLLMVVCSVIAVVMVMIAGLQYILARGNAAGIKKAKERIQNAIIGLVLLMSAYTLAFLVDPSTVKFGALKIESVPMVPLENTFEPDEGVATDPAGTFGQSSWQDCMLNTYGANEVEVKAKLKTITCKGKQVTVHESIAEKFQAVCDAIANVDYTITSFGGQNWRGNANNKKALSAHAWGVAFDINGSKNPNCPDNNICTLVDQFAKTQVVCAAGCEYDIPREIINAFKAQGFGWGGEWRSLKDYMHFSYPACGQAR